MNRRFKSRVQGAGARGQGAVLRLAAFFPRTQNPKPKTRKQGVGARAHGAILLWLMAVLVIFCSGCGKKMMPYYPDKVLPAAPREFRVDQDGDALTLSWLLPRTNLLGQPLTQVQGCRVFRADVKGVSPQEPCPLDFVTYADIDLAYPQGGEVRGEAMAFRDHEVVPEHRYFYKVAAYDQDGYPGTDSPTLSHAWGWLPRTPQNFKAAPGDKTVDLTWSPVTQLTNGSPVQDLAGYLVWRQEAGENWLKLTPQPVVPPQFQDVAVFNDTTYNYKVQAVRRLGGDLLASLDTPVLTAKPQKLTPPPPLLNLLAVSTSEGVALRWEPSPVADLAGYRVYRRGPGETAFARLTPQLLTKPYFVDPRVTRGKTYYYYVTAVDNSPRANESLPSEEAEITY
jgi:uncharacterized protein